MHKDKKSRETHAFTLSLAVLLAGCAMACVLFWQEVREYYLYLKDARPTLSFDFEELSDEWGEADLRKYFAGANLYCQEENEAHALGDRTCFIDINAYNGAPAMTIAFFLDKDRLHFARIAVPFWAYGKSHAAMTSRHGAATLYRGRIAPEPLDAWRLKSGGAVFLNRDPVSKPVAWHQLFWAGKGACEQFGC